MCLTAKGITLLLLLHVLSACNGPSQDYCVLNQNGLRPLLIGQSWQPELGLLDDTHSNCTSSSHPPTLTWRVQNREVVTISQDGGLIGRQSGSLIANGFDLENNPLVGIEGFVLSKNWKMEVDLRQRTTISVGEEKKVRVRAVDAEGRSFPDAWFWITPKNSKVLSQRGCLPLQKTHECFIAGLNPGKTEIRVSMGGAMKTFTIHVH